MGQLDNKPGNPRDEEKAAREVLRSVTDKVRALQNDLSGQLNQDIIRLQGTKHRLLNDIEILEEEYQSLQSQHAALKAEHEIALNQQQLAQQQLWAKRLAQAMATHLQSRLTETIYGAASISGTGQNGSLQNAYQLLASLDSSLNDTLHSLQQDLNSYQSSLSQQISRMHSMEQQGEAILEALINRLSLHLQTQIVRPQAISEISNGNVGRSTSHLPGYQSLVSPPPFSTASNSVSDTYKRATTVAPVYRETAPTSQAKPVSTPAPKPKPGNQLSTFQKGLIFIILSTLALSIHNVLVGIIGYGGQLLGSFPVDGIFPLNIPNSLVLLWLRMLVVLPLMALLAGKLYPNVWQDIRRFLVAEDKRPILQVIASGGFLFMSQVLIYKAISEIGPGVAVTLLFMYPLITVPLAWFLFGDRPTLLRAVVMFAITIGIVFTALPRISTDLSVGIVSPWGVFSGLLSSAFFALYLIAMQLSFRKLHPVPVSLVQFTTIFILTSTILIGGFFFGLERSEPSSYWGLGLGGVLLGGLTLLGYLFNNYGVRLMGAAQASIVASSGPVLTAIMAYLITPGEKSVLHFIQWIGVTLVTLGVLALSSEKLKQKPKSKRVRA
ncbi:MAG: EamA family transporter [Leptolyngbya sp. SIO1D8]|nr:EamA family transporter [Leptolyngbya sp. SIO1D8]